MEYVPNLIRTAHAMTTEEVLAALSDLVCDRLLPQDDRDISRELTRALIRANRDPGNQNLRYVCEAFADEDAGGDLRPGLFPGPSEPHARELLRILNLRAYPSRVKNVMPHRDVYHTGTCPVCGMPVNKISSDVGAAKFACPTCTSALSW